VCKRSGVFSKTKQSVKLDAVQYTVVYRCFSGANGFNFLILYGLGGKIVLPFLSRNDLESLETAIGGNA
jgi:hypothetical protein